MSGNQTTVDSGRLGLARKRLQERTFWMVQLGVAVATAVHFLLEWGDALESPFGLYTGLHHLPVLLYVAPVAYASLKYGVEGGLLTGLWSAVLSVPNILFWHRDEFAWLGEAGATLLVVTLGVLVALPVEREHRERRRAEETSRRLGFLNDITAKLTRSLVPTDSITSLLDQLADALALEAVAFRGVGGEPWFNTGPPEDQEVSSALAGTEEIPDVDVDWLGRVGIFPVRRAGFAYGAIAAAWPEGTTPDHDDVALLVAVARELGVAFDNARLHDREKIRLQRYVQEVTKAQEDERRRIARELHDAAAQPLVLLARGLEGLSSAGSEVPEVAARARELREVTLEILETVRSFSRHLRPTVLDDLGLAPALEWLLREMGERSGLVTEFRVEGRPQRLSADTEVAVFRVAQEALRNVEKHAQASKVSLLVSFQLDSCRLQVTDDGIGFILEDLDPWDAMGLEGMRERAELVGGRIEIHTSPAAGTTVEFEVSP